MNIAGYNLKAAAVRMAGSIFVAGLVATAKGGGSPDIIWQQTVNSDRINALTYSYDGNTLFTGSSDRLINIWNASNGTLLNVLNTNAAYVHESSIEDIAVTSDGSHLATVSYKVVKLWKLPAGTVQNLTGHTDWVVGVSFSPSGTMVASASFDSTVKVWRVSDGALLKTLKGSGQMRTVSFSPDGTYLAGAGGGDKTILVWKTSDWTVAKKLVGHTDDIYAMMFSPDSKYLASGGYDQTARVWSVADWSSVVYGGNNGNVYAVAFTADSSRMAYSDGEGNTIRLCDLNGNVLRVFDQNVVNVQAIAFSANGNCAYGSSDATITVGTLSLDTPPPPPPPVAPQITHISQSSGAWELDISGTTGASFTVDGSNDLKSWNPISTNTFLAPVFQWIDSTPSPNARFYRVR